MKGKDLLNLGYQPGAAVGVALNLIPAAERELDRDAILRELKAVLDDPIAHSAHPYFAEVARALREQSERPEFVERPEPAPLRIWGEGLEQGSIDQIRNAARLPVAVSCALMPDAHLGYGLPIGGVLATENAVIPYAVGVDIACRMKLSVFDVPISELTRKDERLVRVLQQETVFGTGGVHQRPLEHEVLEADWNVTPVTQRVFAKARGAARHQWLGEPLCRIWHADARPPRAGDRAGHLSGSVEP